MASQTSANMSTMWTGVMLNTAVWNSAGCSLGQEVPPGPAIAGLTAATMPAAQRKIDKEQTETVSVLGEGSAARGSQGEQVQLDAQNQTGGLTLLPHVLPVSVWLHSVFSPLD